MIFISRVSEVRQLTIFLPKRQNKKFAKKSREQVRPLFHKVKLVFENIVEQPLKRSELKIPNTINSYRNRMKDVILQMYGITRWIKFEW